MTESKEDLKSFLMKVKENEKTGLNINIQGTKIMASGPITSWQLDGEKMKTVVDFIFFWSGLPFPSPMHESEKWKWSRSVVLDSLRPHGLQPTRLLRPWDFPRQNYWSGVPLPSPWTQQKIPKLGELLGQLLVKGGLSRWVQGGPIWPPASLGTAAPSSAWAVRHETPAREWVPRGIPMIELPGSPGNQRVVPRKLT